MMRRRFRVAVKALSVGIVLAALGCSVAPEPYPARHVVVISLDTTRADHFGFMGNDRVSTPELDALAQESIVFHDLMTVAPTTLASHVSLFTGKYPHHHGTPRNGFMVHPDNVMLAETLQAVGFVTAGFAGSFALDERFDFAQGFAHYDQEFSVQVGDAGADQNQRTAAEVTDAAIDYLDDRGVPERLFLFAHYFDPHDPYSAPAPFDRLYDAAGADGLPPIAELVQDETLTVQQRDEFIRRWELQYAAEISYMDHHVGRLLDELERRGILEEAILVVVSDHGENLRERPAPFDHGYGVYRPMIDAVGVVRLPGGRNGGTAVDQLVATIDLFPTLLGFLGIEQPAGIDGEAIDLGSLQLESRTRFAQATKPAQEVETDPRWRNLRKAQCVREGRYKFISTPYRHTEELYDLQEDPREMSNLLEVPSADTGELAGRLREMLRAWSESADPLPSDFIRTQQDEAIERLKSLGYLQ